MKERVETLSQEIARIIEERLLQKNNKEQITTIIVQYLLDMCNNQQIAFATSLGAEDQVLSDMILTHKPQTKIFTLDTGRLHQETYQLIDRTNSHYNTHIQVYFPQAEAVERLSSTQGLFSFYESIEKRKQCCAIRKLEPLSRALSGLSIWLSGIRKEQSQTRHDMHLVEWDETHGLIKCNPLIDWTEAEIWDYIHTHKIPYNTLHDKGFPSIGCAPCTRAIKQGEDIRAGRWWWENPEHKECGLHS